MTYVVVVLRRAQWDVDHIYDWIAKRSPAGAESWYSALKRAVTGLSHHPESCSLAPESQELHREIRQCFFKTRRGRLYRLLFIVAESEVRILRVRGPGQPPVSHQEVGR